MCAAEDLVYRMCCIFRFYFVVCFLSFSNSLQKVYLCVFMCLFSSLSTSNPNREGTIAVTGLPIMY